MVDGHEFSRALEIERIPTAGRSFVIVAEAGERVALARRLGLEAIDRLRAEGRVRRLADGAVTLVEGRLEAAVTQLCVVTLEPVAAEPAVAFRRSFAAAAGPTQGEVVVDPLGDEPEPLVGPTIDLGEIVAEELALALDPYPRAAALAMPETEPAESPAADRAGAPRRRAGGRR